MRKIELTGMGCFRVNLFGKLVAQVEERVTTRHGDDVVDTLRFRDATITDYRRFGWKFFRGNKYVIEKR